MSFDHFERFFAFTAVGVGLLAVGALNLALGGSGRRVWARAAGSLAACGLAVAALATVASAGLVLKTAGVLAGVVAVAGLAGSEWFARRVAALLTAARKPAARWGLVAVGGLAVALAGAVAFDRSDSAEIEQGMKDLELIVGKPPTRPAAQGGAATDRGTAIVLKESAAPRDAAAISSSEEKVVWDGQYRNHLIRRGAADGGANCHGWVFTGGKFFLAPDDVELILKENGYREVQQPRPGDLVVYRQGGEVAHTAVVRYVSDGQPVMVEGKWGVLGVYLHAADQSVYGTEYTFYRSPRGGHLLAGLDGADEPTADTE